MFKLIITDTSYLVSLFLSEDQNHNIAIKQFEKNNEYLIPNIAITELITVIIYKKNISFAKNVFEKIINSQTFYIYNITETEEKEIYNFLFSSETKISFVDAGIIYLAKTKNLDLLTFDKQQMKNSKKIGVTQTKIY